MSIEIPIEALFQKVQLTPCVNCQKPTTKRCGGCKVLYFCSRSCMKKQWKEHKNECKQIQAQKKYIIDVKKKLNQEQGNPYINHVKTKPYELNTAKYSIHDYFGWREDPKLVAQKEQNREELINWTKKTFPEFRVETIKKIKTCKQYENMVRMCHTQRNLILFLKFDFEREWCIVQANNLAATGDPVFQNRPVCMDGGWYVLIYDSYGVGPLVDIEFEKNTIKNIVRSLGTTYECLICHEYHTSFNHLCHQCDNDVCKKCADTIIKQNNNNYKCPFCRQATDTSSSVKRCDVCKEFYNSSKHSVCPLCKKD